MELVVSEPPGARAVWKTLSRQEETIYSDQDLLSVDTVTPIK
jgi:hypothetical protein